MGYADFLYVGVGEGKQIDKTRNRGQKGTDDTSGHGVEGCIVPGRTSPPGGENDIAYERENPQPDGKGDQHRVDGVLRNTGRTCHRKLLLWVRAEPARTPKLYHHAIIEPHRRLVR